MSIQDELDNRGRIEVTRPVDAQKKKNRTVEEIREDTLRKYTETQVLLKQLEEKREAISRQIEDLNRKQINRQKHLATLVKIPKE